MFVLSNRSLRQYHNLQTTSWSNGRVTCTPSWCKIYLGAISPPFFRAVQTESFREYFYCPQRRSVFSSTKVEVLKHGNDSNDKWCLPLKFWIFIWMNGKPLVKYDALLFIALLVTNSLRSRVSNVKINTQT